MTGFFSPGIITKENGFRLPGETVFPGARAVQRKGAGVLSRGGKVLRVLLKILGGVFSFAVLTVTCLSLILAQPQEDPVKAPAPQPPLPYSPSVMIRAESDMSSLLASFPVPVMSLSGAAGLEFVSGLTQEVSAGGVSGRMATVTWRTQDGNQVVLQSIYPASALSLLGNDYHFVGKLGPTLFGAESVYMETGTTARLHARTDSALYVVTVPRSFSNRLASLSQSLLLLSP